MLHNNSGKNRSGSFSDVQHTNSLPADTSVMPTVKGKSGKAGSGKAPYKKGAKPSGPKTSSTGGISKSKSKPTVTRPAVQQKSKSFQPVRKKKRIYTEKELDIPKLNMITPAGVTKPKGQKKGKIFVDDQESMMTILAMVNADKEGQIESKMMKAVSFSFSASHAPQLTLFSAKWRRLGKPASVRWMSGKKKENLSW